MSPPTSLELRTRPASRSEIAALLVLVAAAACVRCVHFDRMAVEHFDEGVYVSNLWFGAEHGYRYPFRHLYAPLLVPALLEGSMILFGTGILGTMLPGLVFGTLTVPLVWWVGRRWCGSTAGWAASVLIAFGDFHVLYSRTALVDVVLGFWLLLAVHLVGEAVVRNSWRWGVAAGIATGLAWWTKYNGWLPLAIGLAGGTAWVACVRRSAKPDATSGNGTNTRPWRGLLSTWAIVAATAILVWLPVLLDLQPRGGYAAVAANHAGYVVGATGWWQNLARQAANLWWTGAAVTLSTLPLLLAIPLVDVWKGRVACPAVAATAVGLVVFGVLAALCGIGVSLAVFGLAIVGRWIVEECRSTSVAPDRSLGRWLLMAWFVGLLVATPLYWPYPRLVLPWFLVASLVVAGGFGEVVSYWSKRAPERADEKPSRATRTPERSRLALLGAAACVVVGIASLVVLGRTAAPAAWEPRDGIRAVSKAISASIAADLAERGDRAEPLVFVYAEPAAFHHLRRLGIAAAPAGDVDAVAATGLAPSPVYLLIGEHARRTAGFDEAWSRLGDRFELVGEFDYVPSRLVLLNLFSPADLDRRGERPSLSMHLCRRR